jgi:hypothetical protein
MNENNLIELKLKENISIENKISFKEEEENIKKLNEEELKFYPTTNNLQTYLEYLDMNENLKNKKLKIESFENYLKNDIIIGKKINKKK